MPFLSVCELQCRHSFAFECCSEVMLCIRELQGGSGFRFENCNVEMVMNL